MRQIKTIEYKKIKEMKDGDVIETDDFIVEVHGNNVYDGALYNIYFKGFSEFTNKTDSKYVAAACSAYETFLLMHVFSCGYKEGSFERFIEMMEEEK